MHSTSVRPSRQSAIGVDQYQICDAYVRVTGVVGLAVLAELARGLARRRFAEVAGRLRVRLGAGDVVEPRVRAVRVRGLRRDHPGVRPSGGALLGEDDLGVAGRDRVLDDLPGGSDDRVSGLEGLDLLQVVRPVLADVLALSLQQVDGRGELGLIQRVRVLDAEVGLRRHQVHRGVRDVDRRVVRGHRARVRAGVVEDGAPRVESAGEQVGVVHQQVGAVAVRDAVRDTVDAVPRLHLQEVEDAVVVLEQVGVDRRRRRRRRRAAATRHPRRRRRRTRPTS